MKYMLEIEAVRNGHVIKFVFKNILFFWTKLREINQYQTVYFMSTFFRDYSIHIQYFDIQL